MKKYEGMFIVKPELSEADLKEVYVQIAEIIKKSGGAVAEANVWSERRKLCFPINKHQEGIYYLAKFSAPADSITKIKYGYKLNESILRVMITSLEK